MIMNCICGNSEYFSVGHKDDRLIVRCINCGLWYIREVPDTYNWIYISDWYQNQHQVDIGHLPYKDRYWHDYEIAKIRLERILGFRKTGKLLDVGCSNGAFVHCAVAFGYDAYGLDLAKTTNLIERCWSGDIAHEPYDKWDIVTLHDVIEHFIDPKAEIAHLWRILKRKGLLVIQAPDFSCEDFKISSIEWKHIRPIEHIYMMQPSLICRLLQNQGFTILEQITPIPGHCTTYAEKIIDERING